MTSTCNTCIYMHRASDKAGQCKCHSPIVDEVFAAVFPWVNLLDDWCGEYSGNTKTLSESEVVAFIDTQLMPTILTIKPTHYRKDQEP